MKAIVFVAGGVAVWTLAMPAWAQLDPADMQRCRGISQAAARLACYDAIALPDKGSRAGWGAPAATAGGGSGTTPSVGETFGLERRISESAPDQLQSRMAGDIEGWGPGTRFTLENGQIWQVSDGSSAYYGNLPKPRVTISRGLLGGFFMTIEGVAQNPRVRRLQ